MRNILFAVIVTWSTAVVASHEPLRLNQIQVIGTHNSYHLRPPDIMLETAASITDEAAGMDYSHDPLDIQLDHGVRSFELDIQPFADGFHVYHVPILDQESTCPIFRDCLSVVWTWSQQHPDHIPISFLLEFKLLESLLAGKELLSPDACMLELLEAEISSVIPRDNILTPDDVRGAYATLSESVHKQGWPPLKDTRGKLFFVIHNRELRDVYREGRPSLEGRLMFVNSTPDQPDGAFAVVDNPYARIIPAYIASGMIIRVRADAGLKQGRASNTDKRETAFASGAQIISTDFPRGEEDAVTGYSVQFPGGAEARNNPVNSRATPFDSTESVLISSGR